MFVNALAPMVVTLLGMIREVSLADENAATLMVVTVEGTVKLVPLLLDG
jgi:hypothetical protein